MSSLNQWMPNIYQDKTAAAKSLNPFARSVWNRKQSKRYPYHSSTKAQRRAMKAKTAGVEQAANNLGLPFRNITP